MNIEIIAIVFQCEIPFSVVMSNGDIYDVEHCKSDDTLYYNNSGNYGLHGEGVYLEGGRTSDYWLSSEFQPTFNPGEGEGNRLQSIDSKWLLGLESWGIESDTVYCTICEDRFPTIDVTEDACDHVHWSEDGWWAGEGVE